MDIDMKKALRPYLRRLNLEAVLRSAIMGGVLVLPVWLALLVAYRVFGAAGAALSYMPWALALAVGLAYMLKYRLAIPEAARRIDALGQQERISTMVEFAKSESVLCRLQREDALRQLAKLPPSSLRIRFSPAALALCLMFLAMLIGVSCMPQRLIDSLPFAQRTQSEEEILLLEKIAQLRSQIESGELNEADKTRLLDQLAGLEAQLAAGYMDLAVLQEVRQMMDTVSETVVELTPRDTYAAALLEFERLRPLGEAIFKRNYDVVTLVFDNMAYTLLEKEGTEQINALMDLMYDINASLAKPLRDNSQENLRQGMMALSGGLETAAHMAYNRRDNTQMIETAIDSAKTYVREFLGVASQEERYDPYANKTWEDPDAPRQYSAAMKLAPLEEQLTPAQTEHVYDPPQAARLSGYSPGDTDETGRVQRILAPRDERQDGTVPYGQVYGPYYARYLEAISGDAVPEALQEAVKAYFDGI